MAAKYAMTSVTPMFLLMIRYGLSAIILYFVILEKNKGATVGKALMYLRVISRNGYPISTVQAIVRNLTKIFWFPIIFDWALGKLFRRDDRIFSDFTKTIVVNEIE